MVYMIKNLIMPKCVLDEIKVKNPDSHNIIKQIYNVCSRIQSSLRQRKTEVQHLMNLLQGDRHVHWHRVAQGTIIIKDIF